MSWRVLAAVVTTLQLGPSVLALFPAVADGRMDVKDNMFQICMIKPLTFTPDHSDPGSIKWCELDWTVDDRILMGCQILSVCVSVV